MTQEASLRQLNMKIPESQEIVLIGEKHFIFHFNDPQQE